MKIWQLLVLFLFILAAGCVPTRRQMQQDEAAERRQEAALRRQNYISAHWNTLNEETKQKISEGKIWIGMTPEQAIAVAGKPHDINRSVGSWGVHEQWVYGYMKDFGSGVKSFVSAVYLYFENGELTSWQD